MASMDIRIGQGVDVHAFSGEIGTLKLACLEWSDSPLLAGHSDGDVVAHALCDALLSAAGLGDLGSVFGVDDPRWAGASGKALLHEALQLVRAARWNVANATVQLIGQKPRIAARRLEAETTLSEIVGAPVSFSATTTDHLGFLGRGEGLAGLSTALLTR